MYWTITYTTEDSNVGGHAFHEWPISDADGMIYFPSWTDAARYVVSPAMDSFRHRLDVVRIDITRTDVSS